VIAILLAVPDLADESELVAQSDAMGLRVVRRCVDAVDLFAAAATDSSAAVVVSAGLPRLERDAVERMSTGRAVVGLAASPHDEDRLGALGVARVIRRSETARGTLTALCTVLAQEQAAGVWSTGVWASDADGPEGASQAALSSSVPTADPGRREGRVVAVWGPAGAPGRTTIALGLAEALAESGRVVGLVDADTYGPSITMALGLVDDASGLSVACRHADNSTLSAAALRAAGHQVRDDWFVVGGLGRPDRWADLRPAALDRVWTRCREAFDVTVIDTGFCLEGDDGTAWASRRNAAAVSAMAGADQVVAVADSSALGAGRLVAGWSTATAAAPLADFRVVQNRSRSRLREQAGQWSDGVRGLGVNAPIHPVPLDVRAAERCWSHGRSLGERARHSPLRRALAAVAETLVSR
jgi:MinD-like ATPase involved in chromosome partitioning or flagellar assembly